MEKITTELLSKALEIADYEKIDSGKHKFNIRVIELSKTEKSKKDCIRYSGMVTNSKNKEQELNVNDVIDTESGVKYGFGRLFSLYKELTGKDVDLTKSVNEIMEIINHDLYGKDVYVEFIKKQVNGVIINEKLITVK